MKNKTVLISLIAVLLIGTLVGTYYYVNIHCSLDGERTCYDEETEIFLIEEDARLKVQVENDGLKEYLSERWNELHPNHLNALEISVKKSLTTQELSAGFDTDILVTSQNNAAYFISELYDYSKDLKDLINPKIPMQIQDAINQKGYYFIQNSIDGWFFVYNETLLEEMGFNVDKENGYGLPEELNSWEKIFSHKDKILEKSKYLFPLTFKDQESFYPFLTGSRWTLNFTNRGSEPGFDSEEFKNGLDLIQLFSDEDYFVESTDEDPLPWLYEEAFYNRETPFSIMHESMNFENYRQNHKDKLKMAPFPKYNDHHLSPMGNVDGYMTRKDVLYPSASAEVIRILRSPNALEFYKSPTDKVPVYNRNHFADLNLDDDIMEKILAYNFNDTPSVLALTNNPNKLAKDLYREVRMMDLLENFYLGDSTKEETQTKINDRVQEWLDEHDGKEGDESDME